MSYLLRLYLSHKLTERKPLSDPEKLNNSIRSANIDLNPHQVDAAIFAFNSPLSRGAILADEVGLGKTIEAGLIINQLWVHPSDFNLRSCYYDSNHGNKQKFCIQENSTHLIS